MQRYLLASTGFVGYALSPSLVQFLRFIRVRQAHHALVKRGTAEADGAQGRRKRARFRREVGLSIVVYVLLSYSHSCL